MSDEKKDKKPKVDEFKPEMPEDEAVETSHQATVAGETFNYTATAGTIVLKEEDGKPKASIFYIAYTRDDKDDMAKRPLTFSFNGGPGSASVWLHLGILGPRRVVMDELGNPLPPPYKLINNEYSILDVTDLVFIDPITTGYSRAVPGEKPEQFYNFDADIESVGEFIRLYTSRHKRWASPKFLIGESYGTTRASGLAGYLQNRQGMYLNGLMLISSILNFQTARFTTGNDLPFITFLPTYTATAWYHGQLDEELQADLVATLAEVKAFAEGEYATALMKGSNLQGDERQNIIDKLARYTGLSKEYVAQTNLRINIHRFVKQLLRHERRTVGRLDSRFKGIDRDATGTHHEYDPSYITIQGTYTGTFNDYIRSDLNFEKDIPYEILSNRVRPWNYNQKQHPDSFLDVGEILRDAMHKNPHLKIFVANGYYDLATPFYATEYTFSHLGLDPEREGNISMAYYEAGHMMYVHMPSLIQQKDDLTNFILAAANQGV